MSLKIGVPDVDYTSGSPVTGTVSLVGDADIDIETISIKFIGRANTFVEYLTGDLPASDAPDPQVHESQFFTYETVLFQGPETLHAPQSWPFSFVFPSKGDTSRLNNSSACSKLTRDKHYPLPLATGAYSGEPRVPVQSPTGSRRTCCLHRMGSTTISTLIQAPLN